MPPLQDTRGVLARTDCGSWALVVNEQGQRPPMGGGFADTLAVAAIAVGLVVHKDGVFVNVKSLCYSS